MNSTKTRNGTNLDGIPFGNIILKNNNPCFDNPTVITESQINIAHDKVLLK